MKALASPLYLFVLFGALGIAFLAGFQVETLRERVEKDQQLYAVTRHNPDSFYLTSQGPDGFEYALLTAFAQWLNVSLKVRPEDSHAQLYEDLSLGLGQVGAAVLSPAPTQHSLIYSAPYMEVTRVLVYRNGYPEQLDALTTERVLVQADSPSALWALSHLPPDTAVTALSGTTTDLLQALDQDEGDLAIMDSLEYDIDAAYFPNLKVAYDLTDPLPIGWAFKDQQDDSLLRAANEFLAYFEDTGQLAQLKERYFGALNQFNYVGLHLFQRQMKNQLPKYQQTFMDAADAYQLDWRLLAAIGFQESRWRPRAVSPTGVRGIMMLTLPTARSVGVTNRLDATQSIQGGAKFFDRLTRVIPDSIPEPDRTWFTIAAYNVGSGHLFDARKLTEQLGFDPNSWLDVMTHLPLLEDARYYKDLEFGKARGQEAVDYVQNIRRYYDLLRWQFPFPDENPAIPEDMLLLPPAQTISIPATL